MIKNLVELIQRREHVCPWWLAYTFDNPLRKLIHNPSALFSPYLKKGMTAVDIGCGMGFFSIGAADMVGDKGRVIAADLQPEMLEICKNRASKAGIRDRIQFHVCGERSIGLTPDTRADFALTFWMAHEVPDTARFISEIRDILAPEGVYYLSEPQLHVSRDAFQNLCATVLSCGFEIMERPDVAFSRARVFRKKS